MARSAVLKIDILADASKAQRALDATGRGIGKFGKVAAAGAAAAAVGVGMFAVEAVKSASKVEQAFGATESIFGKFAGKVQASANKAAIAVGLSKSEYSDLANVLGAQLKNAGTAVDQLAPKTDKLIGLGADLAATFGGSTADAVAAVSSLLKGERDPIEKYGVSIKAADVAARLQAQGLDHLTGKAKAQAEAQATLAILTTQTKDAQGAFARESGTVANSQQKLGAIWENLKATVGAGLLPILSTLGTFLLETVAPAAGRLADQARANLGPALGKVGAFITGTVIPAARVFYAWFAEKIAPGIRTAVVPVVAGLQKAFGKVQEAIAANRPELDKIGRALKTVAEFIADKVAPVVGAVLGKAFEHMGTAIGTTIDIIAELVTWIESAVGWVDRLIGKLRDSAVGKAIGAIASGLTSSATGRAAGAVTAARTRAGMSVTAALGSGIGGLVPSVSVAAPHVTVMLDGRALTEFVDVRVTRQARATARRLAAGVRA